MFIVPHWVSENATETTLDGGTEEYDPLQLEQLLDRALQDRSLRQSAFTAGCDRQALLDQVASSMPKLDSIGLDQRARIEQAERDISSAKEAKEAALARERVLRLAMLILLAFCAVSIAIIAVDRVLSGAWPAFLGLVAVNAIMLFVGLLLLLGWPPIRLRRRRFSAERELGNAREAKRKAVEDLATVLIEGEIRPILRTYVNSLEAEQHRTTLTLVEQEGLAELEDPRYAIPTRARKQLDEFLDDMPGGSIGLSGPRGVGKTTLIRTVCPTSGSGTKDRFGLVVSAPVEFDPREFLLHLFAETCRSILGPRATADLRRADPFPGPGSRPLVGVFLRVAVVLAPLAGIALILDAIVPWSSLVQVATGALLILAAFMISRTRVVLPQFFLRPPGFDGYARSVEGGFSVKVVEQAADRLQDIWYQQTFTTGWSGKLKAPIGEGGLEGSRELARQQMTLPDIVGEFRRLLADIAIDRRVLIGIDELDKIESREAAYRFMNEMKVLFGLERCFFLLSVSEDAMSSFERRGLPFRDVFDSSFDDVVSVGFLDVDESVALLQQRVIGMPLPFIYLCHCVAGGLARDVIRVAREIIVTNPEGSEGWPLHDACRSIVATDIKAKVEASLVATRAMGSSPGVEILRGWLQGLRGMPVGPTTLFRACEMAEDDLSALLSGEAQEGADREAGALACELLTFLLYAGTLMEFFSPHRVSADYVAACDGGRLDQLASARQALSVHPRIAWECLEDFRDGKGVSTPRFPVPAL